jgi:hypothetical protein
VNSIHSEISNFSCIHTWKAFANQLIINIIIKPHLYGFCGSRNTRVIVFGQEITETAGRGGFQAKDHHKCISAPSEITYATKTTKKQLLILEFLTPRSPWRYADVANDITPTCPTIRMTSLRIHNDTDATEEIHITRTHMLYLIFLYHTRIPRLDRRTPRVKFFKKYIALVIVHVVV